MTSTIPFDPGEVFIYSADHEDRESLFATLGQFPVKPKVKIDRLGRKLMGDEVVLELGELGYDVFVDDKTIEIPTKLEQNALADCKKLRPWMLNCMAGGISNGNFSEKPTTKEEKDERDGLKRFADACHQYGVRPCAVTVLTSKEQAIVKKEFGGRHSDEQVAVYVDWLVQAGFTDAVCSILELRLLRDLGLAIDLNVPGTRMPDGNTHDQARTGTQGAALNAGATRLVIGREFATDTAENWQKIVDHIVASTRSDMV